MLQPSQMIGTGVMIGYIKKGAQDIFSMVEDGFFTLQELHHAYLELDEEGKTDIERRISKEVERLIGSLDMDMLRKKYALLIEAGFSSESLNKMGFAILEQY